MGPNTHVRALWLVCCTGLGLTVACQRVAARDESASSPPARVFAWPAATAASVSATHTTINQFGAQTDTMIRQSEYRLTVAAQESALLITRTTIKSDQRDALLQGLDDLHRAPFLVTRAGAFLRLSDTTALLRRRDTLLNALRERGAEFAPFVKSARAGYGVARITVDITQWWEDWVGMMLRDSSAANGRAYARFDRSVPCPDFATASVCDEYQIMSPTPPMVDMVNATSGGAENAVSDRVEAARPPVATVRIMVERATLRPIRSTDELTTDFLTTTPSGKRTALKSFTVRITEYRWRAN